MSKPRRRKPRVILIGLDGLMPEQIERYRDDVPPIREFLDSGYFAPAHASPYTCTATNWNTIATGASMGTHGVTSFFAHLPGMAVGEAKATFNTTLCQAEYFYHAAERQGKRCILINYPTAFPRVLEKGVTVGGDGLSSSAWTVRQSEVIASSPSVPGAKRIFLREPGDWTGIPGGCEPIREGVVYLDAEDELVWDAGGPHVVERKQAGQSPTRHFLVLRQDGVTKLLMAPTKDASEPVFVLGRGQWSGWVEEDFSGRRAWRQYKALDLAEDGSRVTVFASLAGSPDGWGRSDGVAERIIENVGPYVEGLDLQATHILNRLDDPQTAEEMRQIHADWMARCADYLAGAEDWDAMFVQFHCPDCENHYLLRDLESGDPARRDRAESFFRNAVRTIFDLASRVSEKCADENTLVAVVSDHGGVPIYKYINVPGILVRDGWAQFVYDDEKRVYRLDVESSQCWSLYGGAHLNVRGREKHGCVDPGEEYEALRSKIIDRLRAIKDPETGENVFAFVARREDLAHMGMYHPERSEDILAITRPKYFMHPIFAANVSPELMALWRDPRELIPVEETFGRIYSEGMTGTHCTTPGAVCEYSSNRAVFFLAGPGVRRASRGEKVDLMDIAPTLAHHLGIRPPRQSEGRIVWEAFEEQGRIA